MLLSFNKQNAWRGIIRLSAQGKQTSNPFSDRDLFTSKKFSMKNSHNAMGYLLLVCKIEQFCGFPSALLGSIDIQLS